MNQNEIDLVKGQIKSKIRKGDYITLGEMISENQETARSRFRRGNYKAVMAMKQIVESREKLIEDFNSEQKKEVNS